MNSSLPEKRGALDARAIRLSEIVEGKKPEGIVVNVGGDLMT
jgi:hypothetical protein